MENGDFELEEKLKQLTVESSGDDDSAAVENSTREQQLADIIAQCMESGATVTAMEVHENTPEPGGRNNDALTSLIITNLPLEIFADAELKKEFQSLFESFDELCKFYYLKSFRRARIDFSSPDIAAKARHHINGTPLIGNEIKCYFAQPPVLLGGNGVPKRYLELPAPVRQFLISPPASPPVDWAPATESGPVVNLDLLAAIASLGPGESHELLPASGEAPGIVVHICEDANIKPDKPRIVRTPCPKRST